MAKSLRQKAAPTDARWERNPASTILSGSHFSAPICTYNTESIIKGEGLQCSAHEEVQRAFVRPFECSVIGVLTMFLALVSAAQTPTVLYNFNANNSGDPLGFSNSGTLAQGQDGNIYTTSNSGGTGSYPYPEGTLFSMTPAGSLTELLTFAYSNENGCPEGCNPYSGVEPLPDGNFLVAPLTGGQSGYGPVLIVSPNGTVTQLYSFTGGSDGGQPYASPILGTDGNYYGTTACGGATPCGNMTQGCGTVYQLTPAGTLGWVHQFTGTDGCNGLSPLVQGKDGNFYGSTSGGTGSIFRVTPAGVFTFLNKSQGGVTAPLVQGSDGNLYGTAVSGSGTCGTIFKVTPAGKLTVLHALSGDESEGCDFYAGVVQGTDGYFYAVTTAGGQNNWGTIVRVGSKGGSTFSVLYHFDGANGVIGGGVKVSLLQHTNGSFYGLSNVGGTYNYGTFFSWNPSTPLKPFVSLVTTSAPVGATIGILGQGFTGTKKVAFSGIVASFTVISDTYLTAAVPTGAKSGFVTVKTPSGTPKSSEKFTVTQ